MGNSSFEKESYGFISWYICFSALAVVLNSNILVLINTHLSVWALLASDFLNIIYLANILNKHFNIMTPVQKHLLDKSCIFFKTFFNILFNCVYIFVSNLFMSSICLCMVLLKS